MPPSTPSSTPSNKVAVIVVITARKSEIEYCQARLIVCQSSSEVTATIIVAARVALGRKNSTGVSNRAANPMPTAAIILAPGVFAPASKFTMEREKPPVTGKPTDTAEATLAAPRAISSWLGLMRCRRLAARVLPTDTDSTKPMMEINMAETASSDHSCKSKDGTVKLGSPRGTSPTRATPRPLKSAR